MSSVQVSISPWCSLIVHSVDIVNGKGGHGLLVLFKSALRFIMLFSILAFALFAFALFAFALF